MGWSITYIWGVILICPGAEMDGVNMCKPCPNSWVRPGQTYPSTAELVIPRLFGVNSWVFHHDFSFFFKWNTVVRRLSVMSMINSGSAYHIPAADGFQASYGDYHSLLWNIMSREHAYIYIYDVPIQHGDCPWFPYYSYDTSYPEDSAQQRYRSKSQINHYWLTYKKMAPPPL